MVSESDAPAAAGGTAVLDRPDTIDPDGPIVVYLVDSTGLTPTRLAQTKTLAVIDTRLVFRILHRGIACEVRLDDDGPPLYTVPVGERFPVRPGDQVHFHLPAHP